MDPRLNAMLEVCMYIAINRVVRKPILEGAREIIDYYKPLLLSGISIERPSSTAARLF